MFKKSIALAVIAVLTALTVQFSLPAAAAAASAELLGSGVITAGGTEDVILDIDADAVECAQVKFSLSEGLALNGIECLQQGWETAVSEKDKLQVIVNAPVSGAVSGVNDLLKISVTAGEDAALGDELTVSASVTLSVNDGNGKYTTLPAVNTEFIFTVSECEHSETEETVAKRPKSGEAGIIETRCRDCGALLKSEQFTVRYGDVDDDNHVGITDAIWILRLNAEISDDATLKQKVAGDVDADGKCNVQDAVMVLQYNAQIIDSFPAE